MDREQIELGMSGEFWRFIESRREATKTYSLDEVREIYKCEPKRRARASIKQQKRD